MVGRELGVADLVEVGGFGEAAQTVDAQVEELDVVGACRSEMVDGRLRHDDLVGVRTGRDPGGAVDGAAEVVTVAQRGSSGVHTDPDGEVEPVDRVAHRELDLDRRFQGGGGRFEGDGEAVAGRGEDVPVEAVDDAADALVVFGERIGHRLGMLVPERGRADDVGEQERHVARRWLCHQSRTRPLPHPATRVTLRIHAVVLWGLGRRTSQGAA